MDYIKYSQRTAENYIIDYLKYSCDCDPEDWDVANAASELLGWMADNECITFDAVPVDVFVDIVAENAE